MRLLLAATVLLTDREAPHGFSRVSFGLEEELAVTEVFRRSSDVVEEVGGVIIGDFGARAPILDLSAMICSLSICVA